MKTNLTFLQFFIFVIIVSSCTKSSDNTPTSNIILSTASVSTISFSSAVCGGNIGTDGGSPITAKGVVWSNFKNPTISLSTKTLDGSGIGSFSSNITGLSTNTTYYVRAYATNSNGTVYGNELNFKTTILTVTDIDGNLYPTLKICNQIWTQRNLNVTRYRNGDIIPQVTDPTQWGSSSTGGAWCYYNNDPATEAVYGKLYNWKAVTDLRGLAPTGWHIPSISEFDILKNCVGGDQSAGSLREIGTANWIAPNTGATNSSGFTALPGGFRSNSGSLSVYSNLGNGGYFWSTTDYTDPVMAMYLLLYNSSNIISSMLNSEKRNGMSIRCVKD